MVIPSLRNQLSFWPVFMLGFGFMVGGISNAAHIGGMLGGMLIAILPAGGNVRMPGIDKAWAIIALFSILLWSVTIVFMFVSLSFNA